MDNTAPYQLRWWVQPLLNLWVLAFRLGLCEPTVALAQSIANWVESHGGLIPNQGGE
jgi:hypothetical protein